MDIVLPKNQIGVEQNDEILYRTLDRGIDDMEDGRELPLDEAFDKITELRNVRRNARALSNINMGIHIRHNGYHRLY